MASREAVQASSTFPTFPSPHTAIARIVRGLSSILKAFIVTHGSTALFSVALGLGSYVPPVPVRTILRRQSLEWVLDFVETNSSGTSFAVP